jgi:tRNA A22 N-methylase
MKKIKILRTFSIENKYYRKDEEVVIDDGFAGSPRYYRVIGVVKAEKPKTKGKRGSKGKRIPDRKVKSHNTAITNKDKK